jgi:hypothetical protein
MPLSASTDSLEESTEESESLKESFEDSPEESESLEDSELRTSFTPITGVEILAAIVAIDLGSISLLVGSFVFCLVFGGIVAYK